MQELLEELAEKFDELYNEAQQLIDKLQAEQDKKGE